MARRDVTTGLDAYSTNQLTINYNMKTKILGNSMRTVIKNYLYMSAEHRNVVL